MARLRRMQARQDRAIQLQQEYLSLLEKLENPPRLVVVTQPQSESPTPTLATMPPELELPPPLTPEEIAELKAMPMPNPVEEIEFRLGLSTTPPSLATSPD